MTRKYATIFFASILFLSPSVSSAKSLTQIQINAIVQLLIAFNVDSATIAKVEKSLGTGEQQNNRVATNQSALAPTPASTQTYPSQTQSPQPVPTTPAVVSNNPIASEISVQSSVCNLANTNLKSEYVLADLLQQGNIDGRIWMNAFVLDQQRRNFYNSHPSPTMIITTSDHSNDQTLNGSPVTGPCGFYYGYQFYATKIGTYTITYSIPTLNLSKTVTITIKGPEKPVIGSSGITVSTPQKETDYQITELSNWSGSTIKYWFQASKPASYISAQCSDADTPLTKVDLVSHLGVDGLYYPRGTFLRGGMFSGAVACKFIHGSDNTMTITSESDTIALDVE